MGKKNVSLKTIATELGLSINSVSRALRDMGDISDETKAKVRKKAIELGYMPNQVSQRMKKGEKGVVAFLVESFDNLYFNTMCKEVVKVFDESAEYECHIIYKTTNHFEIIKQCILHRVDLLITHTEFSDDVLEFAKLNNILIIKLGNCVNKITSDIVSIDDDMGCCLAARYLWGRHNCDKYIYAGNDSDLSPSRYKSFKAELDQLGVKDLLYFDVSNYSPITLYEKILDGYLNIFCYNDETAYRILSDLDDISSDIRNVFPHLHVIGFDGLCTEIKGLRPLTTVKIDYSAFAQAIYKMVEFRLENPADPPKKVLVPVFLHQRLKGN